jgi:hypothetical protein
VFCVDRKRAAAEETVGLIEKEGGTAVAFRPMRSRGIPDVKSMVDTCLAKWGRIGSARQQSFGIGSQGRPVDLSEDEWDKVSTSTWLLRPPSTSSR